MRRKRNPQTEDRKIQAVFARIPLEKISGLHDDLWLDSLTAEKKETAVKHIPKSKEKK